jgi:peptide/nickel transport system substrate-binding protein
MRNNLVELDHNTNVVPELAKSWDISPDAKKWVFHLREGVEFHNGKTMDADDVVYSLNLHRGENSKSSSKVLLDQVEELNAEGKSTVVMTLKSGNADFPFVLSQFNMGIVPKGTKDFDKGMGTGPYVLEKFEPGVRCVAKRNPNYWKAGRAHFDVVETITINDVNSRTSALQTGQIDVMNRPDLRTVHMLEKDQKLSIIRIKGTQHFSIPMRTDMKPFDNKDVRLGLKYAIDREQVVKNVLRGYGAIGNDNPISSSYRYFDSTLPQRPYDPDKAKYYLKKGGAADHKFKLHAAEAAFTGAVDTALIYRENAAKAGIDIEVVKEPNDGYWSNVWMKKSWSFCWWFGRPTEDWVFSTTYADDAAWNDTFWKHERFNKLLLEARAELDESKRRIMYAEMQKILSDDGGVVIPVFVNYLMLASKKLEHDQVAPSFEWDSYRISERWWFA